MPTRNQLKELKESFRRMCLDTITEFDDKDQLSHGHVVAYYLKLVDYRNKLTEIEKDLNGDSSTPKNY